MTSSPSPEQNNAKNVRHGDMVREVYWGGKFIATTVIIVILAVLSAYLQYSVYPAIMQNQFGETQVSVHLSVLTYTINAFRCVTSASCAVISGLPAFDFAQLFLVVLAAMQIYHYIARRKAP